MRLAFWKSAPSARAQGALAPRREEPRLAAPSRRRNYAAADTGRLFAGWLALPDTADELLKRGLRVLRGRGRELALNNDWVKGWLRRSRVNVVGPAGIRLQARVAEGGRRDQAANAKIEAAFAAWSKAGTCTVCGRYSFRDVQTHVLEAMNRDGEALIRKVRGFDNGFGFALQLLEADHLDENFNEERPGGANAGRSTRIVMGVEIDAWRRPVAYHLLKKHPGDQRGHVDRGDRYEVLPAADVIHVFRPWRSTQTRGVPEMHSAMTRLKMIGGYEEAALVAARVGAAKMGFFKETEPEAYSGDDPRDGESASAETDAEGNLITNADPGHFERLPPGVDFEGFDPTYPSAELEPFQKHMLRGAAVGMGSSYHGLAGDLSDVNFSSLRQGALDEREIWEELQGFLVEHALEPIYAEWLPLAIVAGAVALPAAKLEKFSEHLFQPRGWDWVDPKKDIEADEKALALKLTSRTRICAKRGVDFEEVLDEHKAEEELAAARGIDLAMPKATPAAPSAPPPEEEKDE